MSTLKSKHETVTGHWFSDNSASGPGGSPSWQPEAQIVSDLRSPQATAAAPPVDRYTLLKLAYMGDTKL